MTEERKPTDLTLFGIQTSIVELLVFRDDIEADPDMTPAEIAESLKACDEQIQAFLGRELVKVDGVAHVLMEMEARAEVAKKERDRLNERVRTWQKRHDWLEERVKEALQFRLNATGQNKLEGETSTLSLRKNPPSVEVRQPELVPSEYLVGTLKLPMTVWRSIAMVIERDGQRDLLQDMENATGRAVWEPIKNAIKEELKRSDPCERCDGTGIVTVPLELQIPNDKPCEQCAKCGGTGKIPRGVSGCVLETGRVRLVVE